MPNDLLYVHGYEGSVNGTKGRWLSQHFSSAGPELPDARSRHPLGSKAPIGEVLEGIKRAIAPSTRVVKDYIAQNPPKVVVASSFGAAVWLNLVREEGFRIPTVLLAPACIFLRVGNAFPHDMDTIIIHGEQDTLIPIEQAKELHSNSGARSLFWPIADEHRLASLTTVRPELKYAVQKLLWSQGSDEDKVRANSLLPPFGAMTQ